ncbi:MAG: dockerin type I domain-containing protein, partial [Planctomycetota bacterium]
FLTYNVHFDAGDLDEANRLSEANNLRSNADGLGDGESIVYLGDFNFTSSAEPGYGALTAAGNGQAHDPVGISSWPSAFFRTYNTQSTRTQSLPDGGANGGMDDRFDLQLVTGELMDGDGLSYIGPNATGVATPEHSYRAFGNDNVGVDAAVNDVTTGVEYSAAVLNALHDFSDHLPVVADYQLPGILSAEATVDNDRVIVGGFTLAQVDVSNDATPVAAAGADTIDFEITSPTAIFTGSTTGEVAPLASAEERPAVILVTAPGVTTTDFDVTSTAADLNDSLVTASVDVTGLSSAEASFEAGTTDTSLTIDFGEVALDSGGGSLSELFDVFNREITAGFTSALDIDGVQPITGDTSTLSLSPWLTQVLAGDSASGTALFDTSVLGSFSATWEIAYSDEDLPGETSGTLTVDLIGEVIAALLEGDYNGDGVVDGADYTFWANRFGGTTPDDLLADGNGDGFVDGADYTYWANRFGNTSNLTLDEINELFSPIAVPEPAVISLLVLLGLPYATRRRGRNAAA